MWTQNTAILGFSISFLFCTQHGMMNHSPIFNVSAQGRSSAGNRSLYPTPRQGRLSILGEKQELGSSQGPDITSAWQSSSIVIPRIGRGLCENDNATLCADTAFLQLAGKQRQDVLMGSLPMGSHPLGSLQGSLCIHCPS